MTTSLTSNLCVDANGLIPCPIWTNIEEVMIVQTSTVLGGIPRSLMSQGVVPRQRPPQIAIPGGALYCQVEHHVR